MADLEDDVAPGGLSETPDERVCFGRAEREAWFRLTLASTPEEAEAAIVQAALALEGVRGVSLRVVDPRTGKLGMPFVGGRRPEGVPDPCPRLAPGGEAFRALEEADSAFLSCWEHAGSALERPCQGFAPLVVRGKALAGLCVFDDGTPFAPDARWKLSNLGVLGGSVLARAQANAALADSEFRYRALLRQCPEGIYLFDPSTRRIEETNERMAEMLGYAADELIGKRLEEVVAHDLESIRSNIEHVLDARGVRPGRAPLPAQGRLPARRGGLRELRPLSRLRHRPGVRPGHLAAEEVAGRARGGQAARRADPRRGRRGDPRSRPGGASHLREPRRRRAPRVRPRSWWGRRAIPVAPHRKDGTSLPGKAECPIYAAIHDGKVHSEAGRSSGGRTVERSSRTSSRRRSSRTATRSGQSSSSATSRTWRGSRRSPRPSRR